MSEELETMNEEVSQDIEQQADAEVAEQAPQSMLDAVTQALNEDASDAEPEVEAQGEADTVVAEGVETQEQTRLLRLLKCDEMQGFLFSKPLYSAAAFAFLHACNSASE